MKLAVVVLVVHGDPGAVLEWNISESNGHRFEYFWVCGPWGVGFGFRIDEAQIIEREQLLLRVSGGDERLECCENFG